MGQHAQLRGGPIRGECHCPKKENQEMYALRIALIGD